MGPLVLLALTTLATAGPVEKADKALTAFEGGDPAQLEVAVARADAAVGKLPDDPAAWGVRARVWLAAATHPDNAGAGSDPMEQALQSFEKAVELGVSGAARAALEPEAGSLESTLLATLTNDVEGKQWSDAEQVLARVLRAHAACDALGQADPERSGDLYALATRVHAQAGDLDLAQKDYAEVFRLRNRDDTGLAAMVGRKLGEAGQVDAALAFLEPVADRRPDDDRLLRTTVELLAEADRAEEALQRIDAASGRLATSVSGAWLAATLYDSIGQVTSARRMWETVLGLDANHVDSLVALSRSWLAEATDLGRDLDAESAARKPYRERKQIEQRVIAALDQAVQRADAAAAVDGTRKDVLQARIDALTARLAKFPRSPSSADKAKMTTLNGELAQARTALAEENTP